MPDTYIDLVPENLANEHLCCIIRAKPNPGITAKRAWLSARLPEGHVFRKLDVKDCVFIEYAPLETAWVPVVGDNWLYIYCLWVASTQKGHGYGSALLESCIDEKGLVVYYDMQCPFIPARVAVLQKYCAEQGIPARFVEVDSLAAAKSLPCVFNNWAVFCGGVFQTVNQLDPAALERILKRK